jgi:transposase
MQYIAFDSHKYYTLACVEQSTGAPRREVRIAHERGALARFLAGCEAGSPVAVETIGNWYWIVDEIERAGCVPRLVHARKAKVMMGQINKTDKLDARGLNQLQRTGTLPMVWIPPGPLRDLRDLPRARMLLVRQRTQLKNRIHATLAKYAVPVTEVTDAFGQRGRALIRERLAALPPHTAYATEQLLTQVEGLQAQITALEDRMHEAAGSSAELDRLQTLPGVGFILAVVIAWEIGDVRRFATAEKLAAYAGTVPRIHASGGRTRLGPVRRDVNRTLKWAYVEAANSIAAYRRRKPERFVSQLYTRIARHRGHPKAIVAVGRHLAEATYWMLTKGEPYREPRCGAGPSTEA